MTVCGYWCVVAMGLGTMGLGTGAYAEGDVTIVSAPDAATNPATQKAVAPDGTPVVHKSLHKSTSATGTHATSSAGSSSSAPTIETHMPVARHTGTTAVNPSAPIPANVTQPATKPSSGTPPHPTLVASVLPPPIPGTFPAMAKYSIFPGRTTASTDSYIPPSPSKPPTHTYPWKSGIITTEFWIGEGGSAISSTDNVGSAWDENWRTSNRGTDNPNDRNGYAPADHAPTVNPFYVALPFNDLALSRRSASVASRVVAPSTEGWEAGFRLQGPLGGNEECAGARLLCAMGGRWPAGFRSPRICFWKRTTVDTLTRAGLDVSPAVFQYLGLDGSKNRLTSWKFVDDEDVPPGQWLKYDELALLYAAMHQMKNGNPGSLPIQKASEPIDDPSTLKSNKQKVGAAKG